MQPGDEEDAALAATAATDPTADAALAATAAFGSGAPPSLEENLRPFGPFTVVERLTEQGAMGVVARGYNAAFDRWELLKFIRPDLANKPEFVRQFFREGRVLAKLSHPNIVQVFATYALDGLPCLAMEFLEGGSLAAELSRSRCSVAEWHDLFLGSARGLAAAHDVGLLHRDLKPENLFVTHARSGARRDAKLIDFGLATADRSRHTAADPTLVAAMSGGTPLYMAPELWRGEEASPRSDVYSLGQAFFFALTGRLPFVGDTVGELRAAICSDDPFPDVRELRPDLPAPLAIVVGRAIAKRKEDRIASADDLVAALVSAASAARPRRVPGAGPYRGLVSYTAAERDVFFGRDAAVAEVLEHLRTQSGVVLVGPSGSGKSSLAQAGVVPAIEEGALGGGITYGSVVLQPRAHPVQSLAAALARRLGSAEKDVLAFLDATPARLGEMLRAALPGEAGVVVVVDQLEELATLAVDPAEAQRFAVAVSSLLEIGSAPVRVVATLRADLMDRLFAIEPLRGLLTRGFYPVRPMQAEGLEQVMVGPLVAAGYRLEDPTLAASVIADVGRTVSGLPLLSFAMAAWWEARDEATRTLPTAAWRALGGLTGALTRHGDRVLATMNDDSRRIAEQILLRLVSADRTRTRVPRASLLDPAAAGPGAAQVLERLLGAKLLHESSGELELVHEALITQWATLRELLVSSGEDRAFRDRVTAAAREWDAQGRPDGALWTSDQAMRLARWFAATNAPLDQLELAFAQAVKRRASRSRVLSRGLAAGVVLVALVFGLVAQSNEREMRRRLDAASESLRQSKAAYVHAETGRLNELATLELRHEPAATLRHAAASFELAHDPALDVLAWHARSLGVSVSLPGLSGPVTSVSVAPHWIAAASGDAAVVLARAATDHVLLDLKDGGAGRITALAFSPDGGALAIGRGSGDVSLGRAPTFAMGGSWHCEGGVEELAWPTGESLSAVCRAGTEARSTLTIDVPAGQSRVAPMPPVPAPRRQGAALLVSSEGPGASLAIDENHMAELRAPGLARAFEAEVAAPAFAWVPARHAAALVARTGEVLVVSLATLGVVARLESPRHEIVSLAADPQGEWIVAGATDGAVQAFDLEQAAVVVTQGRLDPPPVCGLSPDGSAVACASADSLAVRVVERSSGVARPPSRTSAPAAVDAIGLGSDGRSVFTLAGGELRRDGRLVPGLSGVTKLSVADGHVALALVDAAGHAALAVGPLDLEAAPAPSSLPAAITALAWGAHGSRLLVATADRRVRVFSPSPAGAVELDSLDVPSPAAISAVAGADEGEKIVVGTEAGDVFFTASRSDPLRRVASLHAPIGCLSVAEGGRAVVASADRTAFVVDGDTGLSFALGTSSSPVAACSRSPAEDRFSFVDRDGTTWLKALDLADVGASYVPADPADVPTLAAWKGLPVGLGR